MSVEIQYVVVRDGVEKMTFAVRKKLMPTIRCSIWLTIWANG